MKWEPIPLHYLRRPHQLLTISVVPAKQYRSTSEISVSICPIIPKTAQHYNGEKENVDRFLAGCYEVDILPHRHAIYKAQSISSVLSWILINQMRPSYQVCPRQEIKDTIFLDHARAMGCYYWEPC
jgi:hypothetical protein